MGQPTSQFHQKLCPGRLRGSRLPIPIDEKIVRQHLRVDHPAPPEPYAGHGNCNDQIRCAVEVMNNHFEFDIYQIINNGEQT